MNRDDKKARGQRNAALRKLRSFLDANEPGLVYFLHHLWGNQEKAITYKEIREAILAGAIDETWLQQWREDYSAFVVAHMAPAWDAAMAAGMAETAAKYPDWHFDPVKAGVQQWTETRAAAFVTSCTKQQIDGLRAVVQNAATLHDLNVDKLARAVRPMVGLYHQQAVANLHYFQSMIEAGTSHTVALDKSIKFAARQHRYRGYMIARTELAFAYNKGAFEGIQQAQQAGYMGKTVKEWCTADDERVCPICGGLEGKTIDLDGDFDFKTKLVGIDPAIRKTPPAHPHCRCALFYKEVGPAGIPLDVMEEE